MVKYRLAGMGGSSILTRLWSGMVRKFDHCLQFLTCVESDHPSRGDRDLFAGFRIATWTLRFFAELEIAEAGQLDAVAALQSNAYLLDEVLDHVLGFALVEAELLEEEVSQFGFC